MEELNGMQVEVIRPDEISEEEIDFLAELFCPLVMSRLAGKEQEEKYFDG